MSVVIYIVLIGIVYAIGAIMIQRKLADPLKSIETQLLMQEKLKEIKTLATTDKEAYNQKQQEVSKMMMDNMKKQFKPMIVTFPLFLGVFYLLMPYLFSGFGSTTPAITLMSIPLTYSQFFILLIFIIGMIVSLSLSSRDKKIVKRRMAESNGQNNNNVNYSQ